MQMVREINDGYKVDGPEKIKKYVEEFQNEDREHVIVLGLDTTNRVTFRDVVSIGILNASLVHPREIFKKAIINSSNSIIVVHNHPSGSIDMSKEDCRAKEQLKKAGDLLGITLIDFIIITKDDIASHI